MSTAKCKGITVALTAKSILLFKLQVQEQPEQFNDGS